MRIVDLINQQNSTPFSFEVLPPLKGDGTERLYQTIDCLLEFEPRYVNITAHRSEYVYRELEGGLVQRLRLRRRPGSIAIAAAIQRRYGLRVVPHLVCSGNTREDLEYQLIDLQFLGISDLLVLRGDKAKDEPTFKPTGDGPLHATDLIEQVNRFNQGFFNDGSPIRHPGEPFSYGVACYPEKHEEAPNPKADLDVLKRKVSLGAEYAVTQLFFDNERYFSFLRRAREEGITVPIVPGVKPLSKLSQLSVLPKTFHCDLPDALYLEARRCKTDEDVKELGVEWGVEQCKGLLKGGAPNIHFYTVGAAESVRRIARQIY